MQIPQVSAIETFYRTSLEGLRFLEHRKGRGRRSGEAAEVAWRSPGGEFEAADRIEFVLGDGILAHYRVDALLHDLLGTTQRDKGPDVVLLMPGPEPSAVPMSSCSSRSARHSTVVPHPAPAHPAV